ncbi:MAG: hypothetical protein PHX84_03925 [Candidatus Shapirobacteria bacterium]|nr:hypothetical protein [Candidatus Shapirobacteria bacterium]
MKKLKNSVIFLLFIPFFSSVFAEIKLSKALMRDICQTYSYYLGQNYVLGEIYQKYPSLSGLALIAEKEFSVNFNSSIDGIDAMMSKYNKTEWEKSKIKIKDSIASCFSIEQFSEEQATRTITMVRQRAKGDIESPIIETLLLFKAGYDKNPEQEFLDGYRSKYSTNGVGKAKGVAFTIETPKTWIGEGGDRPNVVRKFVSENGRGLEALVILIKDIPSFSVGEKITKEDVLEMLNPIDLKDFLPKGSAYIKSGKLTIENLPGFWVQFNLSREILKSTVGMETIAYVIFYKNKVITIQGSVTTSVNEKTIGREGFKKYAKLFDLMANSLVLPSIYK